MISFSKGWYSIRRAVYHIRWVFINLSWLFIKKQQEHDLTNTAYSIGVTTYVDRYETFLKPLVRRLSILFPDTEVIIAINGYHDQEVQTKYLEDIGTFLASFKNIKSISFHEPQSLCKLWNRIIQNSAANKTFILNDDINIGPQLRHHLEHSGILNEEIALINVSWSHFLISRKMIYATGWFDERFPALGNEDEDYECRLALKGVEIRSFKIPGIKNIVHVTRNFSWNNPEVVNTKYMHVNQAFFNSKWDVKGAPATGYTYVRILDKYVCLKQGMETPEFYPLNYQEADAGNT